jgi:ribosomal protein L32
LFDILPPPKIGNTNRWICKKCGGVIRSPKYCERCGPQQGRR